MDIKLDDSYTLKGDTYCCWVVKTIVSDDGKKYERQVSGYYPTFGLAMESYIDEIKRQVKVWKAKAEVEVQ